MKAQKIYKELITRPDVYKELLTRLEYNIEISAAPKMSESTIMAKQIFPFRDCKSFWRCPKAINHLQRISNSSECCKAIKDSRDKEADRIFSIELLKVEYNTYHHHNNVKARPCSVFSIESSGTQTFGFAWLLNAFIHRNKVNSRPCSVLLIESSGTQTFGFAWLLNRSIFLSLCKLPIKFNQNNKSKLQKQRCQNSKLETLIVSKIIQDNLGIHYCIDDTYMKTQLIDKNCDINAVTIALYFDIVGNCTNVYNNNDGIVISPATNRFQSFWSIKNTFFVYHTLVSKPFFLILHINKRSERVSEFEINQRSRIGIAKLQVFIEQFWGVGTC